MILKDTATFQVLFIVSLLCAWTSLLWRSTVAFTYLKVKSAKCLCLLPVVLVLRIWSCLIIGRCRRRRSHSFTFAIGSRYSPIPCLVAVSCWLVEMHLCLSCVLLIPVVGQTAAAQNQVSCSSLTSRGMAANVHLIWTMSPLINSFHSIHNVADRGVLYRRCGRNLLAKLDTVINLLSAKHACLKTLYCFQ